MKLSAGYFAFSSRLGATILLTLCAATAALRAATFTLENVVNVQPNSTVTVDMVASQYSGPLLSYSISWDSAYLQYNGATPLVSDITFLNNKLSESKLGVTYWPDNSFTITSPQTLVSFSFIALQPGVSAINFGSDPVNQAPSASDPTANWIAGSVQVVPEPVNVALGVFLALGLAASGTRKLLGRRQATS